MRRVKIIATGIGITAFFILAAVIFYRPVLKRVRGLQDQLEALERQIRGVELLIKGGVSGEGIDNLDARYHALAARFPRREEDSLALLYELARQRNLEILGLTTRQKSALQGPDQNPGLPDGRIVQRLPVSISMRGRYMNAHDYLAAIQKELPAHVTVERLTMIRSGTEAGVLMIAGDITLYLLP